MSTPEVSVVIAAYNAERYVHEAIQSVLDQTFVPDACLATLRLTSAELNRLLAREGAVLAGDDDAGD